MHFVAYFAHTQQSSLHEHKDCHSNNSIASINQNAMQPQQINGLRSKHKRSPGLNCTSWIDRRWLILYNDVWASNTGFYFNIWCAVLSKNIHNYSVRPSIQAISAFYHRGTTAEDKWIRSPTYAHGGLVWQIRIVCFCTAPPRVQMQTKHYSEMGVLNLIIYR